MKYVFEKEAKYSLELVIHDMWHNECHVTCLTPRPKCHLKKSDYRVIVTDDFPLKILIASTVTRTLKSNLEIETWIPIYH